MAGEKMRAGEIMERLDEGTLLQEKERHYVVKKEHVFCAGIYPYVREIARYEMLGVNVNDPAEKAIQAMLQGKVNTLPVLEKGEVVGVIRASDLMALFEDLLETREVKCSS